MSEQVAQKDSPSLGRKIVMFPLVRAAIGIAMIVVAIELLKILARPVVRAFGVAPTPLVDAVFLTVVDVVAGIGAYIIFVRFVERRPVAELGREGMWAELGRGIAVGFLLLTAVIAILWLLGFYQVVGLNGIAAMSIPFLVSISAGVLEELAFRGIMFRIIEEYLGSWWALAISALLFGFLHAGNPNATLFSSAAIALEAGILLGAAYMLTKRLWMVIGIHFAWNFTQGGIYGVAISGNEYGGLIASELQGNPFLSGGAFGAEASIFAVLICTGVGIYYVWRAIQAQHVIAPVWVREKELAAETA